jgi:uncharacterized GH25 family protein
MKRTTLATVMLAVLSGPPIVAHDMWIEPTAFHPAVGSVVGVRLRVGEHFVGDPIPRDPKLIEEFVSIDRTSRTPIVGRDGSDPAGFIRIVTPDLLIVGYRSRPTPVVLAAEKFNQYLEEEGLEHVARTRAARNETLAPAREVFSRFAKSLVGGAGGPGRAGGDRAIGFTLELIAERSPWTLAPGSPLSLRLLYEGRPLSGAQVVAISRSHSDARRTARTDANGRVKLGLPHDGAWLIKAVHMVPAKASDADWASYWASLTFEIVR